MSRKKGFPPRCAVTDCAASPLDAAVTAEMTISAFCTASAAEMAQRTPLASAVRRSLLPAVSGNRMSQAVICAASASWKPAAIAWPASPNPIKAIFGLPLSIALSLAFLVDVRRLPRMIAALWQVCYMVRDLP
jgi:hypothetical protein